MTSSTEVIIEPNRSWWRIDLKEVWAYRDLLWSIVRRDFFTRFRQTLLGPLWYVIQPVLTTLVFTVIFGRLAGLSTDGLPRVLFYMTNLLAWNYFARAFGDIANALVANQTVFSKIYFPRLIMPISKLFTNLFAFSVQLLTLIAFMVYFKVFTGEGSSFQPNPFGLLLLPLALLYTAAFAMGCGLIIAAITARYRDLLVLVPFMIQIWMYFSAVVYPLSSLPTRWQGLSALNPMVPVLEYFRYAFLGAGTLHSWTIGVAGVIGLVVALTGIVLFQRVSRTFIDTV